MKNCEANEGRSLFSRCGIFIRPFWGPGEVGVSLRAFSTGVNAYLHTWKQPLYLRTWKQRLYFLTGTSGTYGDSHFKASNDFFVPRMFPSSSQCVLSKFTKFPMCSLTCSELHLSLSHILAQTLSAWNICRWQNSGTHVFSTPAGFCYMRINWEEGRWQMTVGCREVERESKKLFMNASIFRFSFCDAPINEAHQKKIKKMGVLVQVENGDKPFWK